MKAGQAKFLSLQGRMQCPHCASPMVLNEKGSMICEKGHCFDVSGKGYVNLLPRQRQTQYDKQAFESRRAVFQDGFYLPVLDCLEDFVRRYCKAEGQAYLLDAGCGDGYYALQLQNRLENKMRFLGLDLSKEAVVLAASGGNGVCWLVGDLAHLPLQAGSLDAVLNVFTPAHYGEFFRVLKPDGILIKAIPEEGYLQQLRRLAAGQLRKQKYSNQAVSQRVEDKLLVLERKRITATMPVTALQLEQFARMTPMLFHIDLKQLDFKSITEITIDVEVIAGTIKS